MADDPLVDALYRLIRTGELSPGQRVDQRLIAERLEVSRTPLREALRALAVDGILTRTPNAGYVVAKLSAADLLEYYSIRAFLEKEALRAIEWPSTDELDRLRHANNECRTAADAGALEQLMAANRAFHFIMFGWSTLTILVKEIERVWRVSDPYRALHLSDTDRRSRVAADHDEMIAAVEGRSTDRLIELQDAHRATSRQLLQGMLAHSLPQSLIALPQSAADLAVRVRAS